MSKAKSIGTRFETDCVNFLRERLDDDRIERRALHGSKDMGDLFGLRAHGHQGIVEAKCHKTYGPADIAKWQQQTIDERCNADADFALLVIHKQGVGKKRFGENICRLQVRDLVKVMGGEFTCIAGEGAMGIWVQTSLEVICQAMEGVYKE